MMMFFLNLRANGFGVFDMSGNVTEWVFDTFTTYDTCRDPFTDSSHENSASERVKRGGHLNSEIKSLRISYRDYDMPSRRGYPTQGFRLGKRLQRTQFSCHPKVSPEPH